MEKIAIKRNIEIRQCGLEPFPRGKTQDRLGPPWAALIREYDYTTDVDYYRAIPVAAWDRDQDGWGDLVWRDYLVALTMQGFLAQVREARGRLQRLRDKADECRVLGRDRQFDLKLLEGSIRKEEAELCRMGIAMRDLKEEVIRYDVNHEERWPSGQELMLHLPWVVKPG